jgi:AcrR family transcriptional regulator
MTIANASIREVGRHAIRLNLARVAFEKFCLSGFAQVTFDELASAAGVSRSTFLRHFRTKEDAVLFVFDPVGEVVASAFERGGADAGVPGLRDALRAAATQLTRETPELRDVMELVAATPELTAGLLAKQSRWMADARPAAASLSPDPVTAEAHLAAAFACFTVALLMWGTESEESLTDLLDRALVALA